MPKTSATYRIFRDGQLLEEHKNGRRAQLRALELARLDERAPVEVVWYEYPRNPATRTVRTFRAYWSGGAGRVLGAEMWEPVKLDQ